MKTNKYQELLIRLKSCRIISGFKSARSFADTFSVPLKTYSQHESGARKIPLENLVEYASNLKIDPYWLLTGEGFPSGSDELNEIIGEYLFANHDQRLVLPKLYIDKKSQVDGKLLTNILSKLIELISNNNIKINCFDLVEFAYSVYNNIIDTSADEKTKNKLIDLATNSLLTGTQAAKNNYKNIKTS